jgi:hypothetical protein
MLSRYGGSLSEALSKIFDEVSFDTTKFIEHGSRKCRIPYRNFTLFICLFIKLILCY